MYLELSLVGGVRGAVIEVWWINVGVLSNYIVSEIVREGFSEFGNAHVGCNACVSPNVVNEKVYYPWLLVWGL